MWARWSAPLLLLGAALGASIGSGQDVKVDLDPAKSRVEFTLGDVLHTVHGAFQLRQGNVQFDPASGNAAGEVVVDATSGDSGSKARDRRMHRDILESPRYPDIRFRPTRVEGHLNPEGQSQLELAGMFGLHGAEHEIKVPATVQITGNHVTGTMHFQVPYVKWGLKNPSTFLLRVSSEVAIDLNIDGYLTVVKNHP